MDVHNQKLFFPFSFDVRFFLCWSRAKKKKKHLFSYYIILYYIFSLLFLFYCICFDKIKIKYQKVLYHIILVNHSFDNLRTFELDKKKNRWIVPHHHFASAFVCKALKIKDKTNKKSKVADQMLFGFYYEKNQINTFSRNIKYVYNVNSW